MWRHRVGLGWFLEEQEPLEKAAGNRFRRRQIGAAECRQPACAISIKVPEHVVGAGSETKPLRDPRALVYECRTTQYYAKTRAACEAEREPWVLAPVSRVARASNSFFCRTALSTAIPIHGSRPGKPSCCSRSQRDQKLWQAGFHLMLGSQPMPVSSLSPARCKAMQQGPGRRRRPCPCKKCSGKGFCKTVRSSDTR